MVSICGMWGPEQNDEWKIEFFIKFPCLHIIDSLGVKAQIWQKGAFINPVSYFVTFLSELRKLRGPVGLEF